MSTDATVEIQDSPRLESLLTKIFQKKVNLVACNRNAFF
jgi:hypothetical protein